MKLDLFVYLCGLHSLGFAIFHGYFWKIFEWKKELKKISIPNRAILQILNLRLMYVFFGVAVLCFFFTDELIETELGAAFLIGMSLFWVGRTIEQVIFLPYHNLTVHVLTAAFVLGAVLFALPLVV